MTALKQQENTIVISEKVKKCAIDKWKRVIRTGKELLEMEESSEVLMTLKSNKDKGKQWAAGLKEPNQQQANYHRRTRLLNLSKKQLKSWKIKIDKQKSEKN